MIETNGKDFVWAQKYRPKKIEDCIIPSSTKSMVKSMVAEGQITHLMFVGGPGCGKTTLAYAIANELGSDVMYINASLETGIDVLRTKIFSFASTMSLSESGPKLVILDEADGASVNLQAGLKGFLEQFSANCRFIFTANTKHKIIDPIQSRCTVIDFSIDPSEKPKIASNFYRRIVEILNLEKVEFDQKVVAKIVEKNFPDFRTTLNVLQRHSAGGKIEADALNDHSADNIKELIGYLKDQDFKNMRQWIGKNQDLDTSTIFRGIYEQSLTKMSPKTIPQLILILADYGYKSAFALDQQINTTAAMIEIMSSCEWQ